MSEWSWADRWAELKKENVELHTRIEKLETLLKQLRTITDKQAEDEGLWFDAVTAPEAYLQQELRRLHSAIEAAPAPDEFARYLPKITEEILSILEGESFIDFGYGKDHKPDWSQAAVDFAFLLNQHRHAAPEPDDELARLEVAVSEIEKLFLKLVRHAEFYRLAEDRAERYKRDLEKILVRLKEQSDE